MNAFWKIILYILVAFVFYENAWASIIDNPEKVILVKLENKTIEVIINQNDTQENIDIKVTNATKNNIPEIKPTNTHIVQPPYIFDFDGYQCKASKDIFECTPYYKTTGMTYNVYINLNNNMKLIDEGNAVFISNETEYIIKYCCPVNFFASQET